MEQAVETSFLPNQVAAKGTGILSTKVWLRATIVWPMKVTQKRSGATENTFSQAPGFQKTRVFYEKPDPPGLNRPWFKPGNCILPMLNFLKNLILTGKNQGWFKPGGKIFEPCQAPKQVPPIAINRAGRKP